MSNNKDKKLSVEAAKQQIGIFLDYYDIDLEYIPAKQLENVEAGIHSLEKHIRRGRLEIKNEDGLSIVQTLKSSDTISYKELSGKAKLAMGTKKESDHHGRMYALLGQLTEGEAVISKLKGPDLGLAEALGMVFMLV